MVCLPAASRPAAPVLFLRLHELLGNDQLALELALVVLELLVAPVLGIFERLAARTSWLQTRLPVVLQLGTPGGKLGAVQALSAQQRRKLSALGAAISLLQDAPFVCRGETPTRSAVVFGIG